MNYREFLKRLFENKPDNTKILIHLLPLQRSKFFKTPDQAANFIDGIVNGTQNIYTTAGLIRPDLKSGRGKKEDILGVTAMYIDIDLKKKDKPRGVDDIAKACKLIVGHGIDPTLIIDSGNGIHGWWIFKEPIMFANQKDRDEAEQRCQRLQETIRQRAKKFDWDIDSTHDVTRVLRLPGTFNRKDPANPLEVKLIIDTGIEYADPENDFEDHIVGMDQINIRQDLGGIVHVSTDLVLDPMAIPPADLFQDLNEIDPKFGQTFKAQRGKEDTKKWKDTSASSYVMALANYMAQAGWTDQEMADTVIAFYRQNQTNPNIEGTPSVQKALRPDYIERTIALARKSAMVIADQKSNRSNWQIIDAFRYNEDGDAALFVKENCGKYIYDHTSKQWYCWQGHYWQEDLIEKACRDIDSVIQIYDVERSKVKKQLGENIEIFNSEDSEDPEVSKASKAKAKDKIKNLEDYEKRLKKRIYDLGGYSRKCRVLKIAAAGDSGLSITSDQWDQHPYLLPCVNGIVNLKNGKLHTGKPEEYLKTVCPTPYDPDAPPPAKFLDFTNDILEPDHQSIDYILDIFGVSLIGEYIEPVFPILIGEGGQNGKATLIETPADILGPLAGPVDPELILTQKFSKGRGAATPELVSLHGKRFIWASEPPDGRSFDASQIKKVAGGDKLIARSPHSKKEFTFYPSHTMVLLTNKMPQAPDFDPAFYIRSGVINFRKSFLDKDDIDRSDPNQKEAIKRYKDKLLTERESILKLMVERCLRYQKYGLKRPAQVIADTEAMRKEADTVELFISDCIEKVLGSQDKNRAAESYKRYKRWCFDTNYDPISLTAFGRRMKQKFKSDGDRAGVYYLGFKYKSMPPKVVALSGVRD